VLLPRYVPLVNKVAMVLMAAELPIMFWLLIWGAKTKPSDAPAS
jgi:hypothetical protein